jgi:hypothetical protein
MTDMYISTQQQHCQQTNTDEIPTFSDKNANYAEFQRHWSQGTPVVITDIEIQGNWTPEYFIKRYGGKDVTVENCETNETTPITVMEFFLHFGKRTNIMKLKVCI